MAYAPAAAAAATIELCYVTDGGGLLVDGASNARRAVARTMIISQCCYKDFVFKAKAKDNNLGPNLKPIIKLKAKTRDIQAAIITSITCFGNVKS